jgi:sporulation protein YlmC with PRC-barrel domain
LTDQGREIGRLHDIDIDDHGAITTLITAAGPIAVAIGWLIKHRPSRN